MLSWIQDDFRRLRTGLPGSRFRKFRQCKRQQRAGKASASRMATFATGILLIIVGLAIGWLPGPGGFVALIGLALLSREFPGIAGAMDFAEVVVRTAIRWFRKLPLGMQVLATGVALLIVASGIWVAVGYLF